MRKGFPRDASRAQVAEQTLELGSAGNHRNATRGRVGRRRMRRGVPDQGITVSAAMVASEAVDDDDLGGAPVSVDAATPGSSSAGRRRCVNEASASNSVSIGT